MKLPINKNTLYITLALFAHASSLYSITQYEKRLLRALFEEDIHTTEDLIRNKKVNVNFIAYLTLKELTPLFYAIIHRFYAGAQLLLDGGADPDYQIPDGRIPLACAIGEGDPQMVYILLTYKADITKLSPSYSSNRNITVLGHAMPEPNSDLFALLLAYKAPLYPLPEEEVDFEDPEPQREKRFIKHLLAIALAGTPDEFEALEQEHQALEPELENTARPKMTRIVFDNLYHERVALFKGQQSLKVLAFRVVQNNFKQYHIDPRPFWTHNLGSAKADDWLAQNALARTKHGNKNTYNEMRKRVEQSLKDMASRMAQDESSGSETESDSETSSDATSSELSDLESQIQSLTLEDDNDDNKANSEPNNWTLCLLL
jgi:ankyrin repeat protein